MQLSYITSAYLMMLAVGGIASTGSDPTHTMATLVTTEQSGQWATVEPSRSLDASMENDVERDVAKDSLYLVKSTIVASNSSGQETTVSSEIIDAVHLETGSGGYESETMTDVQEQLKEESLLMTTDRGITAEKQSRTIESLEVPTSTSEATILVSSMATIDHAIINRTDSAQSTSLDSLIGDDIVSELKSKDSSQIYSEPVSQSQFETSADDYLTTTSSPNVQTMQETSVAEHSVRSSEDHPSTIDGSPTSEDGSMATLAEWHQSTDTTPEVTTVSPPPTLADLTDVIDTSESATTTSVVVHQSTVNRDRSLDVDDAPTTATQVPVTESHLQESTAVIQDTEDSVAIDVTSEKSPAESTVMWSTVITNEPTQVVESDSTMAIEETSQPISVSGSESTTSSENIVTVPLSTEHVATISESDMKSQATEPSSTSVSFLSETTVYETTSATVGKTEETETPTTTEDDSKSTTINISTVTEIETIVETNRVNCTSSETSPSTTTTSSENVQLPIMKNVKSYDNLSEPEFFNSVTVIFKKPEFGIKDSMYFNQDVFKKVVVCLLNVYEAEEWTGQVLNVTSCDFKDGNGNVHDFAPLKPNDLVIVYPSPKDIDEEEIVSFFIKNNTAKGRIVSRNRTLTAIGEHQHLLSEQMDMEVVDVYGRIPVGLLITPEEKAFHVRHSMLLIILLAVVSSCILAIMTALFCIKCRTQRGRWPRDNQDKTQLQGDANKRPDMGDHLNSDEDIRKDETNRVWKNGNGYYGTENGSGSTVINITDNSDAWVVPYNQLTADEKAVPETLDTKL